MNFTRSTTDSMTSFQATLVNAGYGQLALRDAQGKIAQKWTLAQPKCVIGTNGNCNVRCLLPGIADHHVLLVIGAKQVFMRALTPGIECDGKALNELFLSGESIEFAFDVAGHRFEYVRKPYATSSAKAVFQDNAAQPKPTSNESQPRVGERLKFTFVRALERNRDRQNAQRPTGPTEPTNSLSERPAWVEEIVRDALRPVELKLDHIVAPIRNLERQLRRQRSRLRKQKKALSLTSQAAQDIPDPHTQNLIESQETIQRIVRDQTSRLETVNERVADIVAQLAALERIVSTETGQHSEEIQRTTQSGEEIIRLQREMLELISALQSRVGEPLPITGDDKIWRSSIQRQLDELHESLSALDDIKSSLLTAVVQNRELTQDFHSRWEALEKAVRLPIVIQSAPQVPESSTPSITDEAVQRTFQSPATAAPQFTPSNSNQFESPAEESPIVGEALPEWWNEDPVRQPQIGSHDNAASNAFGEASIKSDYQIGNLDEQHGYVADQMGYTVEEPGYTVEEPGYVADEPGHASHEPGYASQEPGFSADEAGYVSDQPGYLADESAYTQDEPGYAAGNVGYAPQPSEGAYESNSFPSSAADTTTNCSQGGYDIDGAQDTGSSIYSFAPQGTEEESASHFESGFFRSSADNALPSAELTVSDGLSSFATERVERESQERLVNDDNFVGMDSGRLQPLDYVESAFSAEQLAIEQPARGNEYGAGDRSDELGIQQQGYEPAAYSEAEEDEAEEDVVQPSQADLLAQVSAASNTDSLREPTSDEGGDESVEDYMRRLLARMRGVSESEVKLPGLDKAEAKSSEPSRPSPKFRPVDQEAVDLPMPEYIGEKLPEAWTDAFGAERTVPRGAAAEKNRDINAMRELANTSARSAIQTSARRRHGTAILIKTGVALVGLTAGLALISINGVRVNIALIATIASFLVALIWGYDALSTLRPLLQSGHHPKARAAKPSEVDSEGEAV